MKKVKRVTRRGREWRILRKWEKGVSARIGVHGGWVEWKCCCCCCERGVGVSGVKGVVCGGWRRDVCFLGLLGLCCCVLLEVWVVNGFSSCVMIWGCWELVGVENSWIGITISCWEYEMTYFNHTDGITVSTGLAVCDDFFNSLCWMALLSHWILWVKILSDKHHLQLTQIIGSIPFLQIEFDVDPSFKP